MRRPGVEPGSTAWKATMLTVTPPTPIHQVSGKSCSYFCVRHGVLTQPIPGEFEAQVCAFRFLRTIISHHSHSGRPAVVIKSLQGPKVSVSSLWRNRLARSAVNRKVGGSSPPRDVLAFGSRCVRQATS